MALPSGPRTAKSSSLSDILVTLVLAGLILLCLLPRESAAVTMRPMSLDELVSGADLIFVGTVVKTESAWNDERTRIYTYTTFQVDEYLKGSGGTTLVIQTLGGIVGDQGMMAHGVPVFKLNQRDVIFVSTGPRTGTHRVLGWEQGRVRIRTDPRTGEQRISRSLAGTHFVRPPSKEVRSAFEPLRTLDDLRAAIRSRLTRKEP